MNDNKKTKLQLLAELGRLRRRVTRLEAKEAAHQRTEEELYQSRQMLQLVLDTIPQRVFWKDRASSYLGCNKSFAEDAGLDDPGGILGIQDFGLGWESLANDYRKADAVVMESDTPRLNFEEPLVRGKGDERWVRTSKVPLHDRTGTVIGVLGTYEDITDQRRTEEALRRERILLRTLIDNLPDVIYAKDKSCRKILSNLADVHLMGLQSETDVLGKDDFAFYPKEMAEGFFADDQSVLETGQPVLAREEYVVDAEGLRRCLLTSKLPMRDEEGHIVGLMGIGRDITERKKAEEERERLIAELQQALADVQTLSGLVPICSSCKKIRDDKGYWTQLEAYIQARTPARFSHGICPDCAKKLFPGVNKQGEQPPPDANQG